MRYLPLIAWSILIFWFSSQPSTEVSSDVQVNIFIHKLAHVFVYFVLFCTAYLAFFNRNKKNHLVLFQALIYSAIYAITDELHQLFVPTRSGKVEDVFVDIIGIVSAYFIVRSKMLFDNIKKPNK